MDLRHRLPPRRETRRVTLDTPQGPLHVDGGFLPRDAGGVRVAECFLRSDHKQGSDLERLFDDLGVVLSLLLQHGIPPAKILGHLGSPDDSGDRSIVGRAVGALVEIQDGLHHEESDT